MHASSLSYLILPDDPTPLPAQRVLDCVFALTGNGRILHFHLGQLTEQPTPDGVRYALTNPAGAPDRLRCRVIPPLVPTFSR